ncbi:MAG TPA: GNAT family N-acetyltransferase [Bacteroidales bacterium]|nr:GNAT family N-acetyltransferase [Bacteroidales bacterium]
MSGRGNKAEPVIRELRPSEADILRTMLYNAIFIPPGAEIPPFDIIELPEIIVYIEEFGREGDLCLVAETDGEITGAVWTRLFTGPVKGYGFIDTTTPELSMAVLEPYRCRGIGTGLLAEMLNRLASAGYARVSLSVDLANYAYNLYRKFGFVDYARHDESMTMLKQL